ncbi:MAG: hypothetical protein J7K87_01990 [Candidatus Aenigmarchaeota archaeon]|nr:hypothetical protein [Candidatus Aenigmarchaeota archaeon]
MNRKGLFYSALVVIMLAPIIALTFTYSESMKGYGREIGSLVRIKSGFYFLDSITQDVDRSVDIIGKRCILECINHVTKEGVGLDSSEDAIKELFTNKTLNGEKAEIVNTTIYDWINRSKDIAKKRGFILNINITDLHISMYDSFHVLFSFNFTIELRDKDNVFSFEKSEIKNVPVSIEGMEDPIYLLRTNGKVTNKVEKFEGNFTELITKGTGGNEWGTGESVVTNNPYSVDDREEKILVIDSADDSVVNQFAGVIAKSNTTTIDVPYLIVPKLNITNNTMTVVDGDNQEVWNIGGLYEARENSSYISGDGPSFLDRLENKLTNSYPGKGLESLVNKKEFEESGLEVSERSNVDYIYFNTNSLNIYKVKGMGDYFRIDEDDLDTYGVNNNLKYV